MDELITDKAVNYIKRAAAGDKPFFTYVALSHMHPPEAAHPDFAQTSPSRLSGYADVIAEMDYRVGQIVDSVAEAGIADNTIIVFSSDNAAGEIQAVQGGSNGPWKGNFFTPPAEGAMRVPAIACWRGTMPAGVVTEEPLTAHDWYQTFAALAGASKLVPTDRPLDGIDASSFLLGESEHTGRDTVVFFGPDGSLMSVKWANNVKVWLRFSEGVEMPIVQPQMPLFYDLGSDPGERYNLFNARMDMGWMFAIAMRAVGDHQKSVAEYPNIKPGQEFAGY